MDISRNKDHIKTIANAAMDLLYPDSIYCICCGNVIDETRKYSLCDHCIRHIGWNYDPPIEIHSKRRDNSTVVIPDECRQFKVMRCCSYGIYERTMIFSLKYNGKKYIAKHIAKMMYDKLMYVSRTHTPLYDLVLPVPMFRDKLKKRGFNHAALIAKHLAGLIGTEMLPEALVRTKETRPMRGLSPDERKENVKGAFDFDEYYIDAIRGRNVLLIDDFYTTGSTAIECRKALIKGEPGSVTFYAFASR